MQRHTLVPPSGVSSWACLRAAVTGVRRRPREGSIFIQLSGGEEGPTLVLAGPLGQQGEQKGQLGRRPLEHRVEREHLWQLTVGVVITQDSAKPPPPAACGAHTFRGRVRGKSHTS